MKIEVGSEVDSDLVDVLAHELTRCVQSFKRFEALRDSGEPTLTQVVATHDAYTDFLTHLFEFLVGCFKRDRGSSSSLPAIYEDRLVTDELRKAVRHFAYLDALQKAAAAGDPDFMFSEPGDVALTFAQNLRQIRNLAVHVDARRARRGESTTLSVDEFYQRYHGHAVLLFSWMWSSWRSHIESSTFGQIGSHTFKER